MVLCQEATCKVCGRPIVEAYRKVLCGDPECDDADRRDIQRRHEWRERHGDEPYPYPRYRPLVRICEICHKPLNHPSPYAKFCAGWCQKVANSNRMHRFYVRNKDRLLAAQRGYRERKRQVVS